MKRLHKEVLRYVMLVSVSYIVFSMNYDILNFAYATEDISTQLASLLGAMSASTLGTWSYIIKKFFETKVQE